MKRNKPTYQSIEKQNEELRKCVQQLHMENSRLKGVLLKGGKDGDLCDVLGDSFNALVSSLQTENEILRNKLKILGHE